MHPELGQAIDAKTHGQCPAIGVVDISGAVTACPFWIKFVSVLTEANPVTTTLIDLRVVWPTLWSADFASIGLEMDAGQGRKINNHIAFLQQFFPPVSIAIPPQKTAP